MSVWQGHDPRGLARPCAGAHCAPRAPRTRTPLPPTGRAPSRTTIAICILIQMYVVIQARVICSCALPQLPHIYFTSQKENKKIHLFDDGIFYYRVVIFALFNCNVVLLFLAVQIEYCLQLLRLLIL